MTPYALSYPDDFANLERGDTIHIDYSKRNGERWDFDATVNDVSPDDDRIEIDVRDTTRYGNYTVITSDYGRTIRTDYPDPDDNQTLGSDVTVTRPDGKANPCAWCNDAVTDDDAVQTVFNGYPTEGGAVVAVFHDDDRQCASEAFANGWSQ